MLNELLEREFVFFDGAIGFLLQKRGLQPGQRPDIMNVTAPEVVEDIQRKYAEAGSEIIITNSLGANARALKGTGYTVEEIVGAAVGITKRAAGGKALTALDIGPIGEFIKPFGTLTFDESYALYKEQAIAGEAAGADLVAIETMSDLYEIKAAIRAVRENTRLPVFVMMTFDKSGRTFTGCRPESFAITAERLGAAALGINCSLAPGEIFPIAEKIVKSTSLPIIVKPNAGLPNSVTGVYDIGPEEFARQMAPYASLGVKIVGGCCGTTPEFIKELRQTFSGLKPAAVRRGGGLPICTSLQIENIENYQAEANKKVASPRESINDALEQSDNGSAVVTVTLPGSLDAGEAAHVIHSIQTQSDRPLILIADTADVLTAALHEIPGSPAIRCPGAGRQALTEIASKYGAVVI
ncbi:Methionine synthase I (cobalamin-dependent), methyltransferase domain [Sporobacter termitidis DSM 10068]|uniref:Methionine synthase I (Cobalamin-dependent), methyltransferase domain n=1 Tax=Sporobacter termitidis DSM 10068 TaxID=1123282 RepID=A0A1M5ZHD6_9FIRM|nr:homocysteine S-methyltransferase family protein [Sporobacter termitidis]SHI23608.1 Methionine synthase I (cobalamin-dependent), methyltransferase domain [Sporobacter termitidis DSM 10068]